MTATTKSIAQRLERLLITGYQRTIFAVIASAWFFDCLDVAMMTFILSSIKHEFSLNATEVGALASMSFIGMFIGAALSGLLADRLGRCFVFRLSIIVWGISSVACAIAPSLEILLACRVFLGIGMAMELPVAQSLVCEFVPARVRGKYVALMEGAWPVGFISAGIMAHLLLPLIGWRGMFMVQAVPAVFVLIVRRIVPESPRWLSESGQAEKAESVLVSIEERVNKLLDSEESADPVSTTSRLRPEVDSCVQLQSGTRRGIFFPLKELFSKAHLKRTMMLWTLWFFALLGYYGLTTWLGVLLESKGFDLAKSTEYIVLISLAGVPGFFTAAWLVERWGRKPSMILALVASAISAYLYGTAPSFPAMIAFGLVMQFFMFGMWSVLYAYTPELYPTHARATGAGFASSVGRVGALIGPVLIGIILPKAGQPGVFALAAGSLFVAAIAVFLLGEETKGRILEEI